MHWFNLIEFDELHKRVDIDINLTSKTSNFDYCHFSKILILSFWLNLAYTGSYNLSYVDVFGCLIAL